MSVPTILTLAACSFPVISSPQRRRGKRTRPSKNGYCSAGSFLDLAAYPRSSLGTEAVSEFGTFEKSKDHASRAAL